MKKFVVTLLTLVGLMMVAIPAFAQQNPVSAGGGVVAIAAALCMGIAALGGTMGQSRAAAAALEGIARNPQAAPRVQTPMILGLALIESLVLFSFVIAFLIQQKVA